MKFVCANADLVQNINLDTDYDYITASSKSLIMAVETLANSFTKSKSDCVLFVWNTNDPSDLVRATEEACVENINFKKIIDDLEKNLDYSILGDFDLESIELENGMTISVVKYVTMNNFVESKKSTRKSIKESLNFKKDYAVEVMGGTYWLKPFYWDFDEFRDDLLIASEEYGFTYYITEATTTDYRINLEFNDSFDMRYDITFRIIPKSDKATAKELNDYLN